MDIREMIIKNIMSALQGRANEEVINIVSDVLTIELNEYEVQERCTSVSILDNSWERLLKKFIATKRIEGTAESTLRRYYDENSKLLKFLKKEVSEISTYDIRFFLSYKRDKGEKRVSNRTLDGMRRCYSSFFGWLNNEGFIPKNPCVSIAQIKYRKEVKLPFSAVELEKLRLACDNQRDRALVEFLYSTGCRVSEVSNLDIYDVNFELGECHVLGKGNKERIVYLSPVANMYLKKFLESSNRGSDALFTGKGSDRITKNGIEAAIHRIADKAGVDNAHPHRFRRTLATNLLDRGMNIQDVAQILGHEDLKTTQIYCCISQKNVKAAYTKFVS